MNARRVSGITPPSDLICTSEPHLYKGRQWVEYFAEHCELRSDEDVLEVGSGGGRVAVPLADYLTEGRYEGFDTSERDVRWCRENVTARAPNFNFQHASIRNGTYNPDGAIEPTAFAFPYRDAAFDFIYLTSIFTHMLPRDIEHYFGEIARVLRPGGGWLATWFIFDEEVLAFIREGKSAFAFDHDLGDCRVVNPERPEAAVAYPDSYVFALYDRLDFDFSLAPGAWSGRPPSPMNTDGQDIVLARPRR